MFYDLPGTLLILTTCVLFIQTRPKAALVFSQTLKITFILRTTPTLTLFLNIEVAHVTQLYQVDRLSILNTKDLNVEISVYFF